MREGARVRGREERGVKMYILKAVNVSKVFYKGANEIWGLKGVNVEVKKGEILCIWGRSGSGKTTLLNIIGCLDKPSFGKVYLESTELTALSEEELPIFRREKFGFIFQQFNLIPHLTALENVALPLKYMNIPRKQRLMQAAELLELVGLKDRMNFQWSQLSGGEAQRVAIARSFINNPEIIVADEPTGELDTENSQRLAELIKRLNRETQQTFIIVTHDTILSQIAHRTLILRDGQIVSSPG